VCFVGHPLDLVKVRIQTLGANAANNVSVFGMLRETLSGQGIRGLYRGVSAPLVATAPMFAVSFWGYDMGKRLVRTSEEGDPSSKAISAPLSVPQICLAGAFSALPSTVIMAPSERIKCLLQVQANDVEKGGKTKYKGMADCAKQLFKEGGIRSVFKGSCATLLRDIPGATAYFGTYEIVKRELTHIQNADSTTSSDELSPLAVLTAGGLAGMACWSICIPFDVLKSRIQTAPEGMYSGVLDVYRDIMKKEGPNALFRGMKPALIRAFPANAACFMGMEWAKKSLSFMD